MPALLTQVALRFPSKFYDAQYPVPLCTDLQLSLWKLLMSRFNSDQDMFLIGGPALPPTPELGGVAIITGGTLVTVVTHV